MIKSLSLALSLLVVPLVAGASPAKSATSTTKRRTHQVQARVTPEAARATALAKVPGAVIQSQDLEREYGKLLYSFDLKVPGKPGIDEVQVDAITGRFLHIQHETLKQEAREKEMERQEGRKKSHS